MTKVRVRFAPSPTGGLHLGGVRTVLYNYLFARQNNGEFVLRVEDTDQSRYVAGAEQYIYDCLKWCGIMPDESPEQGGPYAPYRQSERKERYYEYAQLLVDSGHAYYAFDTPEELEKMRSNWRSDTNSSPQYDYMTRGHMRNSLSLSAEETVRLLSAGTPYVIRIKMPQNETISFTDMIRGHVSFDTTLVDDKVLLKADGMPTYHLAVVVDDYLMKITHAFRGEEWLPSAPVHLLLWKYLGWEHSMPQWAHLPLILKPDGHGKLSKRDGDRLGFPVFAMNWRDQRTGDLTFGFKERGFLPEAFVNLLALLGWNDGTEQEIFTMDELISRFSMDRVHKSGAKFDYEKAKWFNHEYIQKTEDQRLASLFQPYLDEKNISVPDVKLLAIIKLIKDRCSLLTDLWQQGAFFFMRPLDIDLTPIVEKWSNAKMLFFERWIAQINTEAEPSAPQLEQSFLMVAQDCGLKKGDVMLPFRIMLVGGKFGPGVFDIAAILGKEETCTRIQEAVRALLPTTP